MDICPMKTRKKQSGQAIMEMMIGLIGIAIMFCGFILIARLTTANIDNVLSARGAADRIANNENDTLDARIGVPILHWEGVDESGNPCAYRYRPADRSVGDTSEDSNNFKGELIDNTLAFRIDSNSPSYIDSSFRNLQDVSMFLNAASLRAGSSSRDVPVDNDMPGTSMLLFGDKDVKTITVNDKLYMPFTH